MDKWLLYRPVILMVLLLGGCTQPGKDKGVPVVRTLDGVRLIGPSVREEMSKVQARYMISSEQRLLLRFEDLVPEVGTFQEGKAVKISVRLLDPSQESIARAHFKLCPLAKNWMMAATWFVAHPFRKGAWTHPGGDFIEADCVSVDPVVTEETERGGRKESADSDAFETGESLACQEDGRLCFDITGWTKRYVREGGENNGHILISASSRPLAIYGDAYVADAPRLHWVRMTTSTYVVPNESYNQAHAYQ